MKMIWLRATCTSLNDFSETEFRRTCGLPGAPSKHIVPARNLVLNATGVAAILWWSVASFRLHNLHGPSGAFGLVSAGVSSCFNKGNHPDVILLEVPARTMLWPWKLHESAKAAKGTVRRILANIAVAWAKLCCSPLKNMDLSALAGRQLTSRNRQAKTSPMAAKNRQKAHIPDSSQPRARASSLIDQV